MTLWGYGILAAAVVACIAAVCFQRRKTRQTLEKLNRMLSAAMQGSFTEDSFDETLLSALESKLAHYLAASAVSARNVSGEKEKLKALIEEMNLERKKLKEQLAGIAPPIKLTKMQRKLWDYMRLHPEITEFSTLAKRTGLARNTVKKYYGMMAGMLKMYAIKIKLPCVQ